MGNQSILNRHPQELLIMIVCTSLKSLLFEHSEVICLQLSPYCATYSRQLQADVKKTKYVFQHFSPVAFLSTPDWVREKFSQYLPAKDFHQHLESKWELCTLFIQVCQIGMLPITTFSCTVGLSIFILAGDLRIQPDAVCRTMPESVSLLNVVATYPRQIDWVIGRGLGQCRTDAVCLLCRPG